MDYVNLGKHGVKVSRLCLGTMMFGGATDETESIRIIHRAMDEGINFIDTANVYNAGESERVLGKALKGRISCNFGPSARAVPAMPSTHAPRVPNSLAFTCAFFSSLGKPKASKAARTRATSEAAGGASNLPSTPCSCSSDQTEPRS